MFKLIVNVLKKLKSRNPPIIIGDLPPGSEIGDGSVVILYNKDKDPPFFYSPYNSITIGEGAEADLGSIAIGHDAKAKAK